MYWDIGRVSDDTIAELATMLPEIKWRIYNDPGTSHRMAGCMDLVKEIAELIVRWPLDMWEQATVIRLEPGGNLYAHHDEGWGITIPIETNDVAVSFSYRNKEAYLAKIRQTYHLEVGYAYLTDRSYWHEAYNEGSSNRTNLVLITKEKLA